MGKHLPLLLEIEGILIDLTRKEGWSSRLEAEKILTLILEMLEEERVPQDTKPWTRFAVGDIP